MLLLASAPRSPFQPNDLSTSGKLRFKVHARELGAQPAQLLDVDLSPLVHLPARQLAGHTGPLSNGNQTMVIAGVYTVSRCTHTAHSGSITHDACKSNSGSFMHDAALMTLLTERQRLGRSQSGPAQLAVLAEQNSDRPACRRNMALPWHLRAV